MDLKIPLFPPVASTIAPSVDHLYYFLLIISTLVTLGIFYFIIYYIVRYREGNKVDRTLHYGSKLKIEILWSTLPLVIFMFIFVWSAKDYYRSSFIPQDGMEIMVVGKQWMWKFQHSSGYREMNQLHIPVGKKIKLLMTSQDVIHSFFIPAFRIKKDVLPARYTSVWFEATQAGTYHLFCTEYCGTNHSRMIGKIFVLTPQDYNHWLNTQVSSDLSSIVPLGSTLAARGRDHFVRFNCISCHRTQIAPPLEGLFGREVLLDNGRRVVADENYLRESIFYPKKNVVKGFSSSMPSYRNEMSEEELMEIISYLKSLSHN